MLPARFGYILLTQLTELFLLAGNFCRVENILKNIYIFFVSLIQPTRPLMQMGG
jgi:hypothetical protein